ncbi:MAG: hypothetical protein KDB14_03795 [Planctomycetales bacterium]|nr:hypothetical protein [Planctomycetales bacterium]
MLSLTAAPAKQRAALLRWTSATRATIVVRGSVANVRVGRAPDVDRSDPTYEPYRKPLKIGAAVFFVDGKEQLRKSIGLDDHGEGGYELSTTVEAGAQIDILVTMEAEAAGSRTSVIAKIFQRRPAPPESVADFDPAKETDLERLKRVDSAVVSPKNGLAYLNRSVVGGKEFETVLAEERNLRQS